MMKIRTQLAITTVALLVALPATALADPYTDPTDQIPDTDVLDDVTEAEEEVADDVDEAVEVEAVSAEVLEGTTEVGSAALARTGVSATMFSILAALLLAAGGLLLLVSRRRNPAA